jgi:hypothetical protein
MEVRHVHSESQDLLCWLIDIMLGANGDNSIDLTYAATEALVHATYPVFAEQFRERVRSDQRNCGPFLIQYTRRKMEDDFPSLVEAIITNDKEYTPVMFEMM